LSAAESLRLSSRAWSELRGVRLAKLCELGISDVGGSNDSETTALPGLTLALPHVTRVVAAGAGPSTLRLVSGLFDQLTSLEIRVTRLSRGYDFSLDQMARLRTLSVTAVRRPQCLVDQRLVDSVGRRASLQQLKWSVSQTGLDFSSWTRLRSLASLTLQGFVNECPNSAVISRLPALLRLSVDFLPLNFIVPPRLQAFTCVNDSFGLVPWDRYADLELDMRELDVNQGNDMQMHVAARLMRFVCRCAGFEKLRLVLGNDVDIDSLRTLVQCLLAKPSLEVLHLVGNKRRTIRTNPDFMYAYKYDARDVFRDVQPLKAKEKHIVLTTFSVDAEFLARWPGVETHDCLVTDYS
jgi:hypothetical protein